MGAPARTPSSLDGDEHVFDWFQRRRKSVRCAPWFASGKAAPSRCILCSPVTVLNRLAIGGFSAIRRNSGLQPLLIGARGAGRSSRFIHPAFRLQSGSQAFPSCQNAFNLSNDLGRAFRAAVFLVS